MFRRVHLNNNIPLLMESVEGVRSLCIGIWVKVGSRYEQPENNGISHFLEHMFFKGTASRTAEGIAMEIDSLGGEINALTSSEYTLFYVKVLDEYMRNAIELLTDIFMNSSFPEAGMEKEKDIISEEINMVEDTPSDFIHDLFNRNVWGEEGLGQSIMGKKETIYSFARADLLEHIKGYYGTENIIIACSGNFREEDLIEQLNYGMGRLKRNGKEKDGAEPRFTPGIDIVNKELSEAHLCLGLQGMPYNNDKRYTMHLLNTILGSGFSSRLFQNVREKRGLVYSIYSFHVSYFDIGLWSIYAGTDRTHINEVINIAVEEIRGLSHTITRDELLRAKAQLKGNLILALESTSNKMTNIAKQEIYYGKYFPPEEIVNIVESIELEEVHDLARRLVADKAFALTVYGPVKESDLKGSCVLFE